MPRRSLLIAIPHSRLGHLWATGKQFAIQVELVFSVVIVGVFRHVAQLAPSVSYDLIRTVATLNMALVGIVFAALLRDVD
ncbi:MAG: hypothetical protein H0U72_08380 [Nitrosospira sp.]|nr:hypothetical protein [Nitrosospira sp.]